MQPKLLVKSLHFHTVGRYGPQLAFSTAAPSRVGSVITLAEHAQRKGMASNEMVSMVTRAFHQHPPVGRAVSGDMQAKRFSFVLTLEAELGNDRKHIQVLSGHTEPATELHEDIQLHFDRNTIYEEQMVNLGEGLGRGNLQKRVNLIKDTLVVCGENGQSLNRVNEIFTSIQTRGLFNRMQGGDRPMDLRSTFGQNRAKLVLGKDDSTYGYVNRALRTYETSMRDMEGDATEESIASNALAMLPNANMYVDPVFSVLMSQTQFWDGGGVVAYRELIDALNIRPNDVAIYIDQMLPDNTHKGMDNEIESYIADQAIRAMASLMPTFNLTSLNIAWSGGDIVVEHANSVSIGWDVRAGVQGILKPLKNHLKALTSTTPGGVKLDLRCKVDLYHDAIVEVKVNTRHPKIVVQPMWCSARFSPQVTNNPDQGDENSQFFASLIQTLNTHYVTKVVDKE